MLAVTAAVTAALFTAEGTVNVTTNRRPPLLRMPAQPAVGQHGLQVCSRLSHAVFQLLGVQKIATSSYHPDANDAVEYVNHTVVQMLPMVINGSRNNRDGTAPSQRICVQKFGQLPLRV